MLEKNKESMALKRKAASMLARYDKLRLELRVLEHDLNRACVDYGKSIGVWGYRADHLRMQINREKGDAA